jgi:hypothetical protein
MKLVFLAAALICSSGNVFAKAEKIDWKPCKKEIEEHCTSSITDTEKHECLEEIPKGKASKACVEHNEKQEKKLGHKHDDKHDH